MKFATFSMTKMLFNVNWESVFAVFRLVLVCRFSRNLVRVLHYLCDPIKVQDWCVLNSSEHAALIYDLTGKVRHEGWRIISLI